MTREELNAYCAGLEHAVDICDAYGAGYLAKSNVELRSARAIAEQIHEAQIRACVAFDREVR